MKVCLIGPPLVTDLESTPTNGVDTVRRTREPPLGILSLAAILQTKDVEVAIFDVDRVFEQMAEVQGAKVSVFFEEAAANLAGVEADVFGFGSLAGSYPLTVRLAEAVTRAHPETPVIFGGPQATALDVETLEAFPFVDFVVRGEADETFPRLVETLGNSRSPAGLAGITYRTTAGPVRTPDAPPVTDLDSLPLPAFHLWPGVEASPYVPLEAGRGCPFGCTFCATSNFFSRRFRMKSPDRVIWQMKRIRQLYNIGSFQLIHDIFTAHRQNAIEFCEALLESGEQFKWTCSARTDCIDEELLELMQKAGCTRVFFGVETGSVRMQQTIGKKLDLDQALEAIRCTENLRMVSTVSMITGFPDERREDLRETVSFFINSLCFDRAKGQLYLLTPAPGSPLHDHYRGKLMWDGIFSEVTIQNIREDSDVYALIRNHPLVFPDYYAIPTPFLDRHYLSELRNFILYGTARFRWLIIALHQHSGDLLEVFDLWRSWCARHRFAEERNAAYYGSIAFRENFLEFVGSAYLRDEDGDAIAVATLLEYEIGLARFGESNSLSTIFPASRNEPITDLRTMPRVAPGVALLHLSADYRSVIDHLKRRQSPRDVPRHPVTVAYRPAADAAEVLQLSLLSSALIELCNGERNVREIAELFSQLQDGLDRFPQEEACLFAVNQLVRQGLIYAPADGLKKIQIQAQLPESE